MRYLFSVIYLLWVVHLVACEDGHFWHVTDFHYDPTYETASLSCRESEVGDQIGTFGDMWCDSPWILIESCVKAMQKFKQNVDFILWTGDTILHADVDKLNHTFNAMILDNSTNFLKAAFPKVPVYATFGNHDSYPTGQFPPKNTLLYNESLARWRSWINDDSQDVDFRNGGFYTVKTSHGMRIVALNTNFYYTPNKLVSPEGDPAGQFAWLTETLENAKKQNEKVIVTAHISPGVTPKPDIPFFTKQNDRLVAILRQFADVIVAMHFGHEHADAFKVLKNNAGVPTSPVFLAPSIAPLRFGPMHNPGVRLVKYDRVTGKHIDITQYYLDLYAANRAGTADWKLEYMASVAYNIEDLTAASLSTLIDKMKDSESNEFKTYKKFYYVSPPENLTEECDWKCHASTFCGFTEFNLDDVKTCEQEIVSGAVQIAGWKYLSSFFVVVLVTCIYM